MKAITSLCSHKVKEAYIIKEAAGYGKGERAKIYFFQNHVVAFDVFYLFT